MFFFIVIFLIILVFTWFLIESYYNQKLKQKIIKIMDILKEESNKNELGHI